MLSHEQEKWISHLSKEKVKIVPYNPKTKEVFNEIRQEIQEVLGKTEIIHCGSTALEILGQGEVDVYIPTAKNSFNKNLEKLIKHFGKPGSIYLLKRARFVKYIDDIKIEIFLINKEINEWKNCLKFENYLKQHPVVLKEYIRLKENSKGLTIQEYYRKKLEFINKIVKSHS